MVKFCSIFKRRSDLTREDFLRYWKEKHAPLAISLVPGLRRYVQNHAITMPGVESEFDAIAELWFDDMAALEKYWAWRQTDASLPLREDEKRFSDRSYWIKFFCVEHVMKTG